LMPRLASKSSSRRKTAALLPHVDDSFAVAGPPPVNS
jgi:hypothetical protein